jgi:hypothetical protein
MAAAMLLISRRAGVLANNTGRKDSFASFVEFDLKNILVILEIRVACKDGPAAS